ncbi:hypothetical protein HNR31_000097 [Anoxybacillus caldiproteolyticus]|uniref:YqzH-like protein n=1 Tax=Thermaerobacillus caldiproteolyticus TaxID=247480 RepID=A0A7V9Z3P4_9BACL|nr:hypothetical protein [Anoxybacillus caldiproteolyticus]QPA29946.1 hypothetical protein ISX45_09700 [Anoxybacillus caldiproteolyticus]
MDEKWLKKLIRNCFLHYGHDIETFPLTNSEWYEFCQTIMLEKQKQPNLDLYEIVHDVVYDYLTK